MASASSNMVMLTVSSVYRIVLLSLNQGEQGGRIYNWYLSKYKREDREVVFTRLALLGSNGSDDVWVAEEVAGWTAILDKFTNSANKCIESIQQAVL